jgi:diaminohydroxyphosphoribosylaminopyrimidine deaminase/5-amino-6-(5-phosphoribosylamino)uracil reductase
LKLIQHGRPWVIAKWAQSRDGRLANRTGEGPWISNERSRAVVHQIRGRMDAVVVGRGTVDADDPLLTARPPGPRTPTRVVLDSQATLSSNSQLVRTVDQGPVLVAAGPQAAASDIERLRAAGCEVFVGSARSPEVRFGQLLDELGRRRMTNVLVEGGAKVLASLFAARLADEVHIFIAPTIIGGAGPIGPAGSADVDSVAMALAADTLAYQELDGDIYLQGRIRRE